MSKNIMPMEELAYSAVPGLSWEYAPDLQAGSPDLLVDIGNIKRASRLIGLGDLAVSGSNSYDWDNLLDEWAKDTGVAPEIAASASTYLVDQHPEKPTASLTLEMTNGTFPECNRPNARLTLDHERIVSQAHSKEKQGTLPHVESMAKAVNDELRRALVEAANVTFMLGMSQKSSLAITAIEGILINREINQPDTLLLGACAAMYTLGIAVSSLESRKARGSLGLRDRRWSLFPSGLQPDRWLLARGLLGMNRYNFISADSK